MLDQRELVGINTYGTSLDGQPDEGYDDGEESPKTWEDMLSEELLDALMYQGKIIVGLRNEVDRLKDMLREVAHGI